MSDPFGRATARVYQAASRCPVAAVTPQDVEEAARDYTASLAEQQAAHEAATAAITRRAFADDAAREAARVLEDAIRQADADRGSRRHRYPIAGGATVARERIETKREGFRDRIRITTEDQH